jgi:hypothetical protein
MIRGGVDAGEILLKIKHSALSDSYIKPRLLSDLKRQYKKYTGNVKPEFNTPTVIKRGKRSLLILKVPSITSNQSNIKRYAAFS